MKRGDFILNLLYQVYDSGRHGEEEGFGSFIENVAVKILNLIDEGVLKKENFSALTVEDLKEYLKVEHPISGISISTSQK